MRILVTGAGGLLGTEVVAVARDRGHEVTGLVRADLDITDRTAVDGYLSSEAPDWVFHCAAYTAVDRAEEETELAMRVNRDGAENVARAASAAGARMLYVSTDYVFTGDERTPYRPSDPVGPLSIYGRSKLAGEEVVLAAWGGLDGSGGSPGALVVRIGWLYGGAGRNFVTAILERAGRGDALSVVMDQRGRPTWARNAAVVALELMECGAGGVWHVADGGEATWLEFAQEALRLRGTDVVVRGVSTEEWGAAAPRPAFSVMDLSLTEARVGRPMMDWREALARFLEEDLGGLVEAKR